MSGHQPKPSTITIEVGDDTTRTHELGDTKDWDYSNDGSVLIVRTEEEDHYYPLDSVRKWSVKAHTWKKKITHFYPAEINNVVKLKKEEDDRRLSQGSE